jgi:hypothetical protein
VNYADLQSHCCPPRTDTRVKQGVTILEDHHDRAGCPLRTKSCDALVKWLNYNQGKENDIMLDEQNYGREEYSRGKKDQYDMENVETPHNQS